MKCLIGDRQDQRTGPCPDQTQEKQGQEEPHRAQSLHANVASMQEPTTKRLIKWPPSNNLGEWQKFDEDVCDIVRLSSKSNVDGRLASLTTIITSFAAERFGSKEPKQPKNPYKKNRRADKIKSIRVELKSLKRQFAVVGSEERPALEELEGAFYERN